MSVPVWLNRPINDSSVFFEHFFVVIVESMSTSQSLAFSSVRYIRNLRVSTNQPRITFRSSNFPSALCLTKFIIGLRGSASMVLVGRKTVYRMSGTACARRRGMSLSSIPALKESSMKLSRMMSLGGRAMARLLATANGISSGSECSDTSIGNGEWSDRGSQFGSSARSKAISPIASLTILKKDGAGLLPNGRRPNK